jgi:hypothetical protein
MGGVGRGGEGRAGGAGLKEGERMSARGREKVKV